MSALEAVEEGDYPEFDFPLSLETTPVFEPHMPQDALDRWGFVIVAVCTPSHRDFAERLRKSCAEFGTAELFLCMIEKTQQFPALIMRHTMLTRKARELFRAAVQLPRNAFRARDDVSES